MKRYITLTAVAYEAGDSIGYFLAWCSLIPIFMVVAQASAFILAETSPRRGRTGILLLGQLFNEVLNACLKRLLRMERPLCIERRSMTFE